MTRRLTILLMIGSIAFPVLGQRADEHESAARELLGYLDIEKMVIDTLDSLVGAMLDQQDSEEMQQALAQMSPEEREDFESEMREMRELFDKAKLRIGARIDTERIAEEVYLPLYAENFSTAELKQLVELYKTPLGAKILDVFPRIEQSAMMQTMEMIGPDMMAVFEEIEAETDEMYYHKKAMSDMRSVATALESWAIDHDSYPDADDWDDLEDSIVGDYIYQLPESDPWGEEYYLLIAPDRMSYQIVSGGADGRIDFASKVMMPGATSVATEDPGDDIIYQNGSFLQAPGKLRPDPGY